MAPPTVSVLWNEDSAASDCGKNLALYVGGCIAAAGVVDRVQFFPLGAKTPAAAEAAVKPLVLLSQRSRATVPVPEERFSCETDLKKVKESAIVLVTWDVDFPIPDKLAKAIHADSVVLSFQAGLNGHKALQGRLSSGKVLHGVAGFDVLRSEESGALCHVGDTQLIVERLSKDKAGALNVVNMLESIGFPVWSRGLMKAVWHGRSMAMASHALNALAGGPLGRSMDDAKLRLVHAAIVREGDRTLTKVAAGKKWKADTTGTSLFGPHWLSMALCLPSPLWRLVGRFIVTSSPLPAPMQLDVASGRKTLVRHTLGELADIARMVKMSSPVTREVVRLVEEAARRGEVPAMTGEEVFEAVGRPTQARKELWMFVLRFLGIVGTVLLLVLVSVFG